MSLSKLLDADWSRLRGLSGGPAAPRRWRDFFQPRFAAVALLRAAQDAERLGATRTSRALGLTNFIIFGLEVGRQVEIGPGLVLPHTQGTVIGARSIGANVTIFQQVTLGAREADFSFDPGTRPIIEDGVTIGAGARILGNVTVGAGAVVGANAVVVDDVPPGSLVVGVPARVVRRAGGV